MEKASSIVDLILIDHKVLKDCIKKLKDETVDKAEKLTVGRTFIETLAAHAEAEEECLYDKVKNMEDMRRSVLEGYEEHGIAKEKMHEIE